MNKNRDYELQCLLELLEVVVNKENIPDWKRLPDWRKLYKMADYHHVANTAYAPIMGMEYKYLLRWKPLFEERYHYAVVMQERYKDEEKILRLNLEMAKIHCMELAETVLTGCYTRKENRYPMPVTYLMEPGKVEALRNMMKQLDYEEKPVRGKEETPGEYRFTKSSGVTFVFLEHLTFTGKKINRYFSLSPKSFPKKKGCNYIHVQSVNDFYLYYIVWLAERYAKGEIELRDILDLWQYYLLCYEKIDWKEANKELERLDLGRFGTMIVQLSAMWFGEVEEFEEDVDLLLAMETYILSKGTQTREENERLLPLVREVADIYARDLRKEKRKKRLEMWFPERVYMTTIYPGLENKGYLLPLYWLARLGGNQCRKVKLVLLRNWNFLQARAKAQLLRIKRKLEFIKRIKERFKKDEEDGNKP